MIANWNNVKYTPLTFEDERDPLVKEKKIGESKSYKRQATHDVWPYEKKHDDLERDEHIEQDGEFEKEHPYFRPRFSGSFAKSGHSKRERSASHRALAAKVGPQCFPPGED